MAPDLTAVRAYIADAGLSYDDAQISAALTAEMAAQQAVVTVGNYPADVAEALMRRVACNLEARNTPAGSTPSEFGPIYVGGYDREVRRLEAPHRRLVVG